MSEQKKQRKYGRNRKDGEAYRLKGSREFNKLMDLARHCARYPEDKKASATLEKVKGETVHLTKARRVCAQRGAERMLEVLQ